MFERMRASAAKILGGGKPAASGGSLPVTRTPATARYMRPDNTGLLSSWRPPLRDKQEDVNAAWVGVTSRALDSMHNSGWIAGSVDQMITDVNGADGLTLNAIPDYEELGWSADYAHAWSRRAERGYNAWAGNPRECDVRGKHTIAQIADVNVRLFMAGGESCGRILMRDKPGVSSWTKVQGLAPWRISQETSELKNLHQGVYLDGDGEPIGYRLRQKVAGMMQDVDVAARDTDGRPLFYHLFDGDHDQTRGISPFAPVLKTVRQYDNTADATLTALWLQTIFAATLESDRLPEQVLEGLLTDGDLGAGNGGVAPADPLLKWMTEQADYYGGAGINLGVHGRIATLFNGDKLKFNKAEHPHDNYLPLANNLLRECARCIGTTFESFTGDFKGATFSSLKAGTASVWPVVVRRRNRLTVPFRQTTYEAWLEEKIGRGQMEFPGGYAAFLRNRSAACRSEWRGPPKPSPDEKKTADALKVLVKDLGIMSLSTATGELGMDFDSEQDKRARERRQIMDRDLPDPFALAPGTPGAGGVADAADPVDPVDPADGNTGAADGAA